MSGLVSVDAMSDDLDAPRTSFDVPDAGSADATESIPISRFDEAYAVGRPPWDIDGPQPDFEQLVDAGRITGRVLDVGCGTGEHALFFASRGLEVVGVDLSAIAVRRATEKAVEQGLEVDFRVADVQELADLGEIFDTITDSGCLHTLSDEAQAQAVAGAHAVLRPEGTYWLMCFNEHALGPGPRRITRDRIAELFADGWDVVDVQPAKFKLLATVSFDAQAWMACITRR
jgi:2-polyprenyl-3-methyl-5-hydroxy-6-metoxy-1,4-benzoquinol methylase